MFGMVVYVYRGERRFFRPSYTLGAPGGLPVLEAALPQKYSPQRLGRLSRRLWKKGLRRFLAGEGIDLPGPLVPVDPLPLCRAKGGELALELLSQIPLRERRVALRGEEADRSAWAIAETLCPSVGALLLEFDRGQEALERRLRSHFGAAPLPLGRGVPPQLAVELSPCPPGEFPSLRLWGEVDLLGLTLRPEGPLPAGLPPLPFLELLWETGRVGLQELHPVLEHPAREAEWP